MLTSITSEVATSTVDQVSSTVAAPPVSLSTDPPSSAMDLSLKTAETEVLEQADMYALESSLDNNHLLQVRPIYIALHSLIFSHGQHLPTVCVCVR